MIVSEESPYSLEMLIKQIDAGKQCSYLFFWGHRKKRGAVTVSCCSQWYPAPLTIEGISYPTAEHYMMAGKARLFGDQESLANILAARTSEQAKELGRKIKDFKQEIWDKQCFEIVVRGNLAKFAQNEDLKLWLLATAPGVLVEASPVDSIWGIGLHKKDPQTSDPRRWQGRNLLGFALMRVRDELAQAAPL